jgi:hypothetical protein
VSAILRRAIDGYLANPSGSDVTLDDLRAEAVLLQQQVSSKGSS